MTEEGEDLIGPLKPRITNIAIFILLLSIHILATYSSPGLLRFPFRDNLKLSIPDELDFVFTGLFTVISMPLLAVGAMINFVFRGILDRSVYSFFDNFITFSIFLLYYYFIASILVATIKK